MGHYIANVPVSAAVIIPTHLEPKEQPTPTCTRTFMRFKPTTACHAYSSTITATYYVNCGGCTESQETLNIPFVCFYLFPIVAKI